MVGHPCPNCQEINYPGNDYCQSCGVALGSRSVVISQERPIILSKPKLPAQQLKRLGASVAVGAIALIAEVGILYLRRRVQDRDGTMPAVKGKRQSPAPTELRIIEEKKVSGKRVVTLFSERVVEERRWGRPVRRIVDRLAWRSEETLDS